MSLFSNGRKILDGFICRIYEIAQITRDIGTDVSVANAPIQLAQLPGTSGSATFLYKFTTTAGGTTTLIDISDAELPQTNDYSTMSIDWTLTGNSTTTAGTYIHARRRYSIDIRVSAGNATGYRVVDQLLGQQSATAGGTAPSYSASPSNLGGLYVQLNAVGASTDIVSWIAKITITYNNF